MPAVTGELQLYDTMARAKRRFEPADPKRVTMYVCGPTVYNYAHIGNARPVVAFDVLFRVLRHLYGEGGVVYAANVTDVDDKINAKAAEEGVPISVITDRYLDAYHADMSVLGALRPTLEPRATGHIDAIQDLIARLIQNNAAYPAEGHVLFNTQGFSDYGELSGRSMDDMVAGARVDVAPYKQHPADFVLWKPSKPGEPVWDSPWGPGRPGWHIECSAMIAKSLGVPIDIHGGGNDLIFPHHENENAQSRCADHAPVFARYWLHNGFVNWGSEKMSKSLGNVVLVHDLVTRNPGEALRWALMSAHYRAPLQWSDELVSQSRRSLDRLYGALRRAGDVEAEGDEPAPAFMDALLDDLNTPRAFAELFALAGELETAASADRAKAKGALLASGRLIGLLGADPEAWFQGAGDDVLKAKVEQLIAARAEARKAKDWATADRIRDELNALNVEVMDGPQGATWRLKQTEAS
jgi:cysteinyl-tRNA synthetase